MTNADRAAELIYSHMSSWDDETQAMNATQALADAGLLMPDHFIDAEKVREVIADWGDREVTSDAYTLYRQVLALLPAPALPTLADMTPEERKACQWMQADVSLQGETLRVVITRTVERYSSVEIIDPNGFQVSYDHELVTPLPDLPRLEWPAQEPHLDKDSLSGMWVDDGSSPSDAIEFLLDKYEEHDLPRPEDVPTGEPWVVQHESGEWIGCRNNPGSRLSWFVIGRDYHDFDYCYDGDITLISRLVPEVKP